MGGVTPSPLHRPPIILELDLTQPLVDPPPGDPLGQLRSRGRHQLRPTLRALHEAADDPRVVGLVAKVGGPMSWSTMHELHRGLQPFLDARKPTIAWAETFPDGPIGTCAYVLAAGFDEIWLQPGGGVGLLGVAVETTFLRGAFDKLGIEPQLEQRHEYKNAADRFMRTELTDAHREALDAVAASVFADALAIVGAGRSMTPERVRELVDSGPRTAAEAQMARLVDRLGYRDEVLAALRERVGAATPSCCSPTGGSRGVGCGCRPGTGSTWRWSRSVAGSPRVAAGPARWAARSAATRLPAELRAALDDDRVRGVVLHVESPGGSAVASEVIWREVGRVREAGKPVVASMGDVAASGGYYVSCPADRIVALPSTLTGSIGVLGGKFVTSGLLAKLGLTEGSVQQGERARMWSARRGFSDEEWERLNAEMDAIYTDFVGKVAAGRGRSVAEIEPLARGRVWSGRDAYENGLVDDLGGLRDATRIARRLAELPDDAPLQPAVRVPLPARLVPPRNSDDPRALLAGSAPSLRDLTGLAGPSGVELRMIDVRLR